MPSWIQDPKTLTLVPAGIYHSDKGGGSLVFVRGDYEPYQCPVTGVEISGRRAHRENLERHGCHLNEPGVKEAAERVRSDRHKNFIKKVRQVSQDVVNERGFFKD